ncbi:MAG TPA: WYL domain-containing protein, partial [Oscillospiraceae bacterium]|nr:WYL domain-containing protein [Oscillospiraceae bacterium]
MDTPQSKKMMIVNILEILKKYSDEKHRLTQKDFIRLLKEDYAMDADRKAIRRNLTNLMEAGYPIGYDESVRAGMDGEEESLLTNWYLER